MGTSYRARLEEKRALYHYFIRFHRILEPDEWWRLMGIFIQSMSERGVVIDDFIYSRKEDLAWLRSRGGIDYCEGFIICAKVEVESLIKKTLIAQNIQVTSVIVE